MLPRSRGSQLYLLQLVAVAAGLLMVILSSWRAGLWIIGLAFVCGAVARVVVPPEHTGMLRVRGKSFDVFWMGTLGIALVILAIVVPPPPG